MSLTTNESDLAIVYIGCRARETDVIYNIMFNEALPIKFRSVSFATRKTRLRSDHERHDPQLAAENELTICGRVQPRLTLRKH